MLFSFGIQFCLDVQIMINEMRTEYAVAFARFSQPLLRRLPSIGPGLRPSGGSGSVAAGCSAPAVSATASCRACSSAPGDRSRRST